MNAREHYGTWVGQAKDPRPPFPPPEPLNLPKGDPRGPVEDIREAAARLASRQSAVPQTRNVIVMMTAPGREWSSQSFDSVKAADMSMTWDLAGDERRKSEITYVAYFEKSTNKLLFEWDFWREGGRHPDRWQKPKQPSPSKESSGMLVALGILGAVAAAGYLFLRDSPEEKKEWKKYTELDRKISEALRKKR